MMYMVCSFNSEVASAKVYTRVRLLQWLHRVRRFIWSDMRSPKYLPSLQWTHNVRNLVTIGKRLSRGVLTKVSSDEVWNFTWTDPSLPLRHLE